MDTRTEAERRYDAEKDGSAYFGPELASAPTLDELKRWIDARLAEEAHYTEAEEADVIIALLEQIEAHFERKQAQ